MHELSLAGAVLSLRLLVPAVPAVELCPLSSGCEHSARALGGSVVLWHTMAVPVVLRGWSGAGSCWCCLPGVQPLCPEQEQPQLQPVLHSRGWVWAARKGTARVEDVQCRAG